MPLSCIIFVVMSSLHQPVFLKYTSLVTLTVQNAALNIFMRMARTQSELFITSTAVTVAEVIKIITCIIIITVQENSLRKCLRSIHHQILLKPTDTLKVAIPSIVYYIQNCLIYVGATHLDAATAQVTYQLKILTTALFSVSMLGKKLHRHQWISLVVLFIGVALVQLVEIKNKSNASASSHQSPFVGFCAILIACCLSGFAGVYFEKILKGSGEVSLWIRNIQLASFAVPFGLLQVLTSDWEEVTMKGFWYGYTNLTWSVILLQALGGLLVAVVVKYSDNILKGFSTSLSIIISSVASVYIFNFQLTGQFIFGASLVIASIFLYGKQVKSNNSTDEKSLLPLANNK